MVLALTTVGFGYPPSSGFALLHGALPLRYCATRFAHKVPSWKRPARGGVGALAVMDSGGGALGCAGPSSSDSGRTGGGSGFLGPGYKSST